MGAFCSPPKLANSLTHTRRHWRIKGFGLFTSFVPAFAFALSSTIAFGDTPLSLSHHITDSALISDSKNN